MSIVTTFHLLSSVGLDSILMRRLKESLSEIIKNCLAAMVSTRLLTFMSYMYVIFPFVSSASSVMMLH